MTANKKIGVTITILLTHFIHINLESMAPRGNTVNRAPMDIKDPNGRQAPEILLRHLMEGIGIALDLNGGRMFLTDL